MFIDYGDVWESKWNQLHDDWQTFDRSYLDAYVSATEYNYRYSTAPLYTSDELLSLDYHPHPENLSLRCHYGLHTDSTTEENVFAYDGDVSELADNWEHWKGDNTGFPCEVLERVGDDGDSYVVRFEISEESDFRTVSNVPREAIKFFDNPYSKYSMVV